MNIAQFRSFFHTTFPQHATATVSRVSPKQSLNNWEATKANSALAMFCFEASYNLDEQALDAFICAFSETPFLNCAGLILELSFQKNGDFAVYVYAAIEKIQAIEQALTQEAAELDQQQAEYEAAQAENEAEEVAQSTQQTDANDPQTIDVSADITYQPLGINAKQTLVLGETTAEQMQDNTQQEDAPEMFLFLELAHPESLTDAEIKDFFEEFDLDTYSAFKIGSGGSMWKFIPANIDAEEQTVIFYFKNPYSFDCGVPILAEYFQCEEAEYRAAYTAFYKHHQKIAGVPIPPQTPAAWGLRTDLEADERDVDYILHFDIRCACVGILGEYLDNARIVKWYRKSTKQVLFRAYQEVGGQLICIENVIYLYPKSDLNLHRAMRAELDRQTNLIKNPNN